MNEATRYPLSWPFGWKRTPAKERQRSDFSQSAMKERRTWEGGQYVTKSVKGTVRVTMTAARDRLVDQLERLGAQSALVSTNVELTAFGLPRGGRAEPPDPGVAVYFELGGKDRVLACDRWQTVAENVAAIAAHIDAIRRVDRYGVGTLEQAFAGYDALPAPGADNRPPWRKVLGITENAKVDETMVRVMYRLRASALHPDKPTGSHDAMAQLNEARDAALQEIGAA